jgi:poly-beta-1,6-N-acetyl-D-glucosamine biosynthesis protein PgaD
VQKDRHENRKSNDGNPVGQPIPGARGDARDRADPAAGSREVASVRQSLHFLVSILMWGLYGYYWYVVLRRGISPTTVQAIQALAVIVICGLLLTLFWVRYNLRLARGDRRRGAPAPPDERLEHDTLGRAVEGPGLPALRRARIVQVRLDDEGRKVFAADDLVEDPR